MKVHFIIQNILQNYASIYTNFLRRLPRNCNGNKKRPPVEGGP